MNAGAIVPQAVIAELTALLSTAFFDAGALRSRSYAYALNRPTMLIDPSGYVPWNYPQILADCLKPITLGLLGIGALLACALCAAGLYVWVAAILGGPAVTAAIILEIVTACFLCFHFLNTICDPETRRILAQCPVPFPPSIL
jgi:hypothetical protein